MCENAVIMADVLQNRAGLDSPVLLIGRENHHALRDQTSSVELDRVLPRLASQLGRRLTLLHVFRQQAERGPRPVRPIADRISQDLEQGESLEVALKREQAAF